MRGRLGKGTPGPDGAAGPVLPTDPSVGWPRPVLLPPLGARALALQGLILHPSPSFLRPAEGLGGQTRRAPWRLLGWPRASVWAPCSMCLSLSDLPCPVSGGSHGGSWKGLRKDPVVPVLVSVFPNRGKHRGVCTDAGHSPVCSGTGIMSGAGGPWGVQHEAGGGSGRGGGWGP